jgi:hypothetical protein
VLVEVNVFSLEEDYVYTVVKKQKNQHISTGFCFVTSAGFKPATS